MGFFGTQIEYQNGHTTERKDTSILSPVSTTPWPGRAGVTLLVGYQHKIPHSLSGWAPLSLLVGRLRGNPWGVGRPLGCCAAALLVRIRELSPPCWVVSCVNILLVGYSYPSLLVVHTARFFVHNRMSTSEPALLFGLACWYSSCYWQKTFAICRNQGEYFTYPMYHWKEDTNRTS